MKNPTPSSDPQVVESDDSIEITFTVKIPKSRLMNANARRIIGQKDFAEFGFPSPRSFGEWLCGQHFSFRSANKRCAYVDDVLAALEKRRKPPAPAESGESIDDVYERYAGGKK